MRPNVTSAETLADKFMHDTCGSVIGPKSFRQQYAIASAASEVLDGRTLNSSLDINASA
jgi:hypothetical protein